MTDKKTIQIVGPVASEYSLAKVNRNLASALAKLTHDYRVTVYSGSEFGSTKLTNDDLDKYRELQELTTDIESPATVAIFNSFPRNPNDLYGLAQIDAEVKLANLAWEESVFPKRWVDECNKHLHGVMVSSEHVREVFRRSGVKLPMVNISEGIDHIMSGDVENYKLNTKKQFKFLHVSSAHFRKGIDVLLRAYFTEFTGDDEVCLVLKLFPNSDSEAAKVLSELKRENAPEVLVIEDGGLSEGQMRSIYGQCQAAIYPSRAEGFGLPMAESMFLGLPLVTSGYSGQLDFCDDSNSWLLDYEMIDSKSHLNIPWSKVAEPSQSDLQKYMRYLFENINSVEVERKVELAKKRAQELTWKNSAQKALEFIRAIEKTAHLKQQKLAVVSSKNSKSGIAVYSDELYQLIEHSFDQVIYIANKDIADRTAEDNEQVLRTWKMGETVDAIGKTVEAIKNAKVDFAHIQYHPGEYSRETLAKLVQELKKFLSKVFITIHAVQQENVHFEKYARDLSSADKIFVHAREDLEFLQRSGYRNAELFTYGINMYRDFPASQLREKLGVKSKHVIASHGLIHDRKGLVEIIEALPLLRAKYPDILFLSVNALNPNNLTSMAVFKQMKSLVAKQKLEENVIFITDFLDQGEVIRLLQLSDLALMPYAQIGEGSSGAVRAALCATRPVIISNSDIFHNLTVGYRIEGNHPQAIADAVSKLFSNDKLYHKQELEVKEFIAENSWESVALEYLENF